MDESTTLVRTPKEYRKPRKSKVPQALPVKRACDISEVFVLKPYGKPCHIWLTRDAVGVDAFGNLSVTPTEGAHDGSINVYIVENMQTKSNHSTKATRPLVVHNTACASVRPTLDQSVLFGYWNVKNGFFIVQGAIKYRGNDVNYLPIERQLALLHNIFVDDIDVSAKNPRGESRVNLYVPHVFATYDAAYADVTSCPYNVYSIVKLSDGLPRFSETRLKCNNAPAVPNAKDFTKDAMPHVTHPNHNASSSRASSSPSSPSSSSRTSSSNVLSEQLLVRSTSTFDLYELYRPNADVVARVPRSKLQGGAPINDALVKSSTFVGHALISDYRSSKYMNNIFHNIRENRNLDLLEESESEEEFEDTSHDKWLRSSEWRLMLFHYNSNFKKWSPDIDVGDESVNEPR